MTPELLTHIIENFAYQHALKHHTDERELLVVLLNYGAFKDVRQELYKSCAISQTRPDFFIFRDVRVSWTPLIEDPEKYIFGVTEPAALP